MKFSLKKFPTDISSKSKNSVEFLRMSSTDCLLNVRGGWRSTSSI